MKLQWTNETYHIQTIYQNLCFGGVIENICQKRVMMIMAGWLPSVQWISGGGGECWDNVTVATELRCGLAVSPALTPHSVSRTPEHQNTQHPTLDSAHCTETRAITMKVGGMLWKLRHEKTNFDMLSESCSYTRISYMDVSVPDSFLDREERRSFMNQNSTNPLLPPACCK